MKAAIALTALATSLFALTPAMAEETMDDSVTVTHGNVKEDGYEDPFFTFNKKAAADAGNYFRLNVKHKTCSKDGHIVTISLWSRFKRVDERISDDDTKALINDHYKKTIASAFGKPLDDYVGIFEHSQIGSGMRISDAVKERIDYPLYAKELRDFSAAATTALESFKNIPSDSGVEIVHPTNPILGPHIGFGGEHYGDYDNPSPLCNRPN